MARQVTVTLPEELHARLEEEAQRRRVTPAAVIEQALEALANAEAAAPEEILLGRQPVLVPEWIAHLTPEERAARVDAAFGAFAHIPVTVDEFLREKHAEATEEEERWERRFRAESA